MFRNTKTEKFSLRKYKDGRTDSKLIGAITILGIAMLAGGGTASANVSSGGQNETTLVSEFEKVSSSAKTTFTDDQNPAKKVTVDVVADIRYNKPTKANQNTGDPDGTARVKFSRKATVNYLLEEDHSKIIESKIYEEKGNVYTNYDKKGISYDTDGKAYRGSGIERTGDEINKDTGGGFRLEANNKEYQLVRSEIVDENKATYEKTHFNDIEAPVSPEGMHNNLGEINYGKITGKVYLVEETSDGNYGKFVEASGVSSDEDAVAKWKNGQATAKDFTKENVTLKEGDTVLVMDRDTYAHGSGRRTVNRVEYSREKVPATPKYDEVVSSEEIKEVGAYPTYAFRDEILNDSFLTIGKDGVFGTSDDGEVTFKNEEHLRYERNWKIVNRFPEMTHVPDVDFRKMSVNEILRYMQSEVYGVLEYFDHYAKTVEQRQKIQERRAIVDRNIVDAAEMIKNENINIAAQSWRIAFLSPDKEKLTALRKHIESGEKALNELLLTLKTDEKNVDQYGNQKNVKKITKEVLYYKENYGSGYPKFSHWTIVSYHKDAEPEHYSDWKKDYPEVETREDPVYANKGVVTISDDLSKIKVVNAESTTRETEFTKQDVATREETDYVVKEIITPVRAYKVMDNGSPVVNHYYEMLTRRNIIPSSTQNEKVGKVMVQYVSNTGEKLKSDEIVAEEEPYEISNTYDLISGTTKVGEEKVIEKLEPAYDTTPKRFNTIIADKTGFTYEFDGIAFDSAPERSIIDKGQTIVKYVYRLVSKEDSTPVKKEVRGSVIVKYVDIEGNEIKPAETLVNDVVLRTTYTYTTKSGDKVVSTRDVVKEFAVQDYNAKEKLVEEIMTADGKTYKYHGVYPASTKFNNVTSETGKVVEGVTTVVYQYVPAKPSWEVPSDAPILEVPEYEGAVASTEPPVLEVPEYKGGVPSERSTILEVPEYRGSVLVNTVEPIPNPKEQLQNLPTVEKLEEKILTLSTINRKKSERLPNTGEVSSSITALGFMTMLSALVISTRKRRKNNED